MDTLYIITKYPNTKKEETEIFTDKELADNLWAKLKQHNTKAVYIKQKIL